MSEVTAVYLFRRSKFNELDHIINDLINIIDSKILTAHESGFNFVTYELPLSFNINNMDQRDAQIYVYSEILTIYKTKKGFNFVDMKFDHEKTVLCVRWINGMTNEERKKREDIIRKSTIMPRNLETCSTPRSQFGHEN